MAREEGKGGQGGITRWKGQASPLSREATWDRAPETLKPFQYTGPCGPRLPSGSIRGFLIILSSSPIVTSAAGEDGSAPILRMDTFVVESSGTALLLGRRSLLYELRNFDTLKQIIMETHTYKPSPQEAETAGW